MVFTCLFWRLFLAIPWSIWTQQNSPLTPLTPTHPTHSYLCSSSLLSSRPLSLPLSISLKYSNTLSLFFIGWGCTFAPTPTPFTYYIHLVMSLSPGDQTNHLREVLSDHLYLPLHNSFLHYTSSLLSPLLFVLFSIYHFTNSSFPSNFFFSPQVSIRLLF